MFAAKQLLCENIALIPMIGTDIKIKKLKKNDLQSNFKLEKLLTITQVSEDAQQNDEYDEVSHDHKACFTSKSNTEDLKYNSEIF